MLFNIIYIIRKSLKSETRFFYYIYSTMIEPISIPKEKHILKEKYEVYMLKEDILCVHYFENKIIEECDVAKGIKIGMGLSPNDSTKLIVIVDNFVEVTRGAREYTQNNMRILKAEAYVMPALANRIMFNLYTKLRKRRHPSKALNQLEDAIEWLQGIE